MNSILNRILTVFLPWKYGSTAGIYQLILKPGLSLLSREDHGRTSSELRLSLISRPDYLASVVKKSYESVKFLNGGKIPFRVKLISQSVSNSLRYGLVEADHSIQVKGEKHYIEDFTARVRETILNDQREARFDSPHVTSQSPDNWLAASASVPVNLSQSSSDQGGGWLKSLGVAGLLLGVVAALAWFSDARTTKQSDAVLVAVNHLRRRGAGELQLARKELVEGGEKFYFQGPTEDYTVVVDKDGRVYSWSRGPSNRGGTRLT